MTLTITDHDRLFLLNVLTDPAHDLAYAAEASQLPVDTVRDIVVGHGWPDRAKLGVAAKVVRGKIERAESVVTVQRPRLHVPRAVVATPPVPRVPEPEKKAVAARPATKTTATRPATGPAPVIVCKHTKVIETGKKSDRQQTRTLAERAESVLKQLADQVARDEAKAREKASRDAAREAARLAREKVREAREQARAEITKLEEQLAALRAKAGPGHGGTDPRSVKIRAWARENGHAVKQRGNLPRALVEAYEAAQGGDVK